MLWPTGTSSPSWGPCRLTPHPGHKVPMASAHPRQTPRPAMDPSAGQGGRCSLQGPEPTWHHAAEGQRPLANEVPPDGVVVPDEEAHEGQLRHVHHEHQRLLPHGVEAWGPAQGVSPRARLGPGGPPGPRPVLASPPPLLAAWPRGAMPGGRGLSLGGVAQTVSRGVGGGPRPLPCPDRLLSQCGSCDVALGTGARGSAGRLTVVVHHAGLLLAAVHGEPDDLHLHERVDDLRAGQVAPGPAGTRPAPPMPGRPPYLPAVPQHRVPWLGELLPTDDPQHQLLLELPRQGVFGVGVEDAWGAGSEAERGRGSPPQRGAHSAPTTPT